MPKLGRRPPINKPAIHLANILTGQIPAHPDDVDYGQAFTGWQMLGNDQYGDCVAVTWANQRALITTVLGEHTNYPTLDQVIELYKTQNPDFPNQDDGMVIQTLLEHLVKQGGPDGTKALGFAKVDLTNPDEVRAGHAIFGDLWYGIDVQAANQEQFTNGETWTYDPHSQIEGGHSVNGVGYDPDDIDFITWAAETKWDNSFEEELVEEAWIVIWPEHLGTKAFLEGIDQTQLAADYHALTGRDFPVTPTPTPTPPEPTPPEPNVKKFLLHIGHEIAKLAGEIIKFAESL
jgi:hypothetical protein